LKQQVKAGAHMVQLFDSWAGILGETQYKEFGLKYINQIVNAVKEVPVTVFSKGAISSLDEICNLNCNTVGLDWNMNVPKVRQIIGESKTIQGNLDPCALYASHSEIEQVTISLINSFSSQRHIVNLGHGVYPDIDPEKVKTFIKTVKNHEIQF